MSAYIFSIPKKEGAPFRGERDIVTRGSLNRKIRNTSINFVRSSKNDLQLSDHITADIMYECRNRQLETSASDGVNIIIRDLRNLHICILTLKKYFWKYISLQTFCLSYSLQCKEGRWNKSSQSLYLTSTRWSFAICSVLYLWLLYLSVLLFSQHLTTL